MPFPNYGLTEYKSGNYMSINKYLRTIRGVKPAFLPSGTNLKQYEIDNLERIISDIDKLMVPNVAGSFSRLYRGTGPTEFKKFTTKGLSSLIDGKIRKWKAYTSTSDVKRYAEGFASGKEKGILLEIIPSPNVSFIDLRTYKDLSYSRTESEILLARDTSYKITKCKYVNEPGRHYALLTVNLI